MGTWKGHFKVRRLNSRKSLSWATQTAVRTKEKALDSWFRVLPAVPRALPPSAYCLHVGLVWNPASGSLYLSRPFIFPCYSALSSGSWGCSCPRRLAGNCSSLWFFLSCSHVTKGSALRRPASSCLIFPASFGASLSSSLGHFCELLSMFTDRELWCPTFTYNVHNCF